MKVTGMPDERRVDGEQLAIFRRRRRRTHCKLSCHISGRHVKKFVIPEEKLSEWKFSCGNFRGWGKKLSPVRTRGTDS
jgi:hypothetical protein